MKHIFILSILGAFLLLIGVYIINNVNPLSQERVLEYAKSEGYLTDNQIINNIDVMIDKGMIFRMIEPKNLFVFFLVFSSSFICFFAAIHISIDKLFFKKFYESPNIIAAYRRGAFICIAVIGIFFLKLISSLYWYNAFAIILLCFFIEVFITGISKEKKIK